MDPRAWPQRSETTERSVLGASIAPSRHHELGAGIERRGRIDRHSEQRSGRAPHREGEAMEKVWMITGASKGFGRVWARAALERGDSVAATARDVSSLEDLVAAHGERVLPLELDVTDKAAIDLSVSAAHER